MLPLELVGDRFRLEHQVAQGGMGTVYRALDLHTSAHAAVKLVEISDARSVERFAREARTLAELRHPGIVQYLAHGRTAAGQLFLAMEWLEGEDLDTRLGHRGLSVDESVRVVGQVAAALAVAHARRVVHRDIKPANIFLDDFKTDQVKLLDFGIARLTEGVHDRLTATGLVIGSPRYMAPEQASGSRTIDARADVFALGAVLYRCLAGRLPFPGKSVPEVLLRILNEDPPRLRELRPALPPQLDDLVYRMMAKDPARRPADASAVLTLLMGLDSTAQVPAAATASGELTEEEQRTECVILVRAEASEALSRVAAAHGGFLEPVEGGTAIVLSGQGVATDQARLAARCALALAREQPELTMAVVIGRRQVGGTGSRLKSAASDLLGADRGAGIRIDPQIAGLLDARFAVAGDDRGLILRGESAGDDEARTLLGRVTPYVGRDAELAQLTSIFETGARDGEARAVLVTAAPGMGKSRLRQELLRRLPDVEVWQGRGDPMRAGAPFALLGEAVRRAAGIIGDEPLDERRRLLVERVAKDLPRDRVTEVSEFLGELAGVPFAGEDSLALLNARRDPRLLGDRMRAAFEEWLDAVCAARPVLIVVEDLHWGDAPTVRFLDSALEALRERPFMVLALARPEVREVFPELWSERGVQVINLGELSRKSAERLVRLALGDASPETVARVVERAGGNAFYLEELIRQVATHGAATFPESLLAMVEARLQALPAEARRALRAGSVFGEVFWASGLRSLLGGVDPTDPLEELTRREFIRRRARARFAGEDEYSFRHGLVREAAYAMLTDADRSVGHRLAGEWLATAGETDALALAEHFQRGGVAERAVTSYLRAAEQALAGNDMPATVERAERGVACGAAGAERGQLRLLQAEAHNWSGNVPAAQQAGLEAMAHLPPGSASWYMAAGEAVAASGKLDDHELVLRLANQLRPSGGEGGPVGFAHGGAERSGALWIDSTNPAHAIAFARATMQAVFNLPGAQAEPFVGPLRAARSAFADDPRVLAWIEQALVQFMGRGVGIDEALTLCASGAAHYLEIGDPRNACLERTILGALLVQLGSAEESEAILREVIATAEGLRLEVAKLMGTSALALALLLRGQAAEALALAETVVSSVVRSSAATYPVVVAGLALHRLGDARRAEAHALRALDMLRPHLDKPGFLSKFPAMLFGHVMDLLVASGRAAEADTAARAATEHPDEEGLFGPAVYHAHSRARRALGDEAGADRLLAQTWRVIRRQAAGIADPERRRRFLDLRVSGGGLIEEVRLRLGEE